MFLAVLLTSVSLYLMLGLQLELDDLNINFMALFHYDFHSRTVVTSVFFSIDTILSCSVNDVIVRVIVFVALLIGFLFLFFFHM